ncbi:hypothetical protein D3C87_1999940 [compost metagenome]
MGRRNDTHQRFHQRGLAHAVAAHDGDDLAGFHGKIHAVDHLALAVGDVQVFDCKHVHSPNGRDRLR